MRRDLIERYRERLHGVLSCYDRIVVTGTLPQACYAEGMTAFLKAQGVRIFDYPRFAEPLRDALRARAQELATSAGITIEHISKAHIRKEDVVAKVLERRGDHPGLVHVISAMDACDSYRPWHDKTSGQTFLKPHSGKVAYPVVPGRRRCGMPDGMSRRERRRRGRRWRGRDRLPSFNKPSLTRGAAPRSYSSDAGRAALSAPPVAAGERQRSNAAPTLMN